MIVVDASLAAKWMLWEADTLHALRLLFHYRREIHAPETIFTEVAGAIVSRANISRAEGADIRDDAVEALRKWTIAWGDHVVHPRRVTQHRLYAAGRLAIQLGHPIADCIYLILARQLDCPLVTCDAKFHRKAAALDARVKLLKDLELPPHPMFREN